MRENFMVFARKNPSVFYDLEVLGRSLFCAIQHDTFGTRLNELARLSMAPGESRHSSIQFTGVDGVVECELILRSLKHHCSIPFVSHLCTRGLARLLLLWVSVFHDYYIDGGDLVGHEKSLVFLANRRAMVKDADGAGTTGKKSCEIYNAMWRSFRRDSCTPLTQKIIRRLISAFYERAPLHDDLEDGREMVAAEFLSDNLHREINHSANTGAMVYAGSEGIKHKRFCRLLSIFTFRKLHLHPLIKVSIY